METPKVSVVTIAHNRAHLIGHTIESVRSQTLDDFEYILIDDASSDDTLKIIERHASQDSRIRVFKNETILGQAIGINRYLSEIKGSYVAMLDSDDISRPERLAKQVEFLESNPDYGAVGCTFQLIDQQGSDIRIVRYPTSPILAKWNLFFSCSIMNSALMVRTELLNQVGGYRDSFRFICDYELVTRLAEITKIRSLLDTLVEYRIHPNQMTHVFNPQQIFQASLLRCQLNSRWLGLIPKLHEHRDFIAALGEKKNTDRTLIPHHKSWLKKMETSFIERFKVDGDDLELLTQDVAKKFARL